MSAKRRRVINDILNINIQNTRPYRPDYKAVIERRFGITQSTFRDVIEKFKKYNRSIKNKKDNL